MIMIQIFLLTVSDRVNISNIHWAHKDIRSPAVKLQWWNITKAQT